VGSALWQDGSGGCTGHGFSITSNGSVEEVRSLEK
jgi:hypothetical protein